MELKIVIPESNDYCEAVGISPERQQELSKALDEMVRREDMKEIHFVKMHDIFAEIVAFCSNEAEIVYCTTLHCGWHARKGRILAPGPLNRERIKLGYEQLYDRLRKDDNYESCEIMRSLLNKGLEDPTIKGAARAGVQRLLDLGETRLALDIMNKLTGFAF